MSFWKKNAFLEKLQHPQYALQTYLKTSLHLTQNLQSNPPSTLSGTSPLVHTDTFLRRTFSIIVRYKSGKAENRINKRKETLIRHQNIYVIEFREIIFNFYELQAVHVQDKNY